ncbi:MAG: enoyl-CoA hydratase-related protein, partial [Rhodoferax sp.]
MTELVHYTLADGVATLTLANGKVNAISPTLLIDFNTCLDRAEQDAAVVVITASGTVLSGGFDLTVMKAGGTAAVDLVADGFALSRRLLSHPYPVVVSTPGQAVALGAFLLL